jgi:hypothetical protein
MFPPTPADLADVVHVDHPIRDTSPGAAWLMATAARAAEVQQQIAQGHSRDTLVSLHAHYAIEDPHIDHCTVAADLHVPLCHRARASGQQFAASVALFRVARSLLDKLTACEPVAARAAKAAAVLPSGVGRQLVPVAASMRRNRGTSPSTLAPKVEDRSRAIPDAPPVVR